MLQVDVCWYESESWRTFLLLSPRRELLLDHHAFAAWVAGVHHRTDEVCSPAFAPGSELRLVPEPENPFDPHAVAVHSADGSLQAGYLIRAVAAELHDVPTPRCGVVLGELLEGEQRMGLSILVAREAIQLRRCPDDGATGIRARRLETAGRRYYASAGKRRPDPEDPVAMMARMLEELQGGQAGRRGLEPGRPPPP